MARLGIECWDSGRIEAGPFMLRFARLAALALAFGAAGCGTGESPAPPTAAEPLPVPSANSPVSDAGAEPPANPFAIDSPWQSAHRMPHMQASSPWPGPGAAARLSLRSFQADAGVDFGTSPWHVLGSRKYGDAPSARALWGVSLTDAYKYVIDGDVFRYAGRLKLHDVRLWIGWNFLGLAGDRIIVPVPNGLRSATHAGTVCGGQTDALVELGDGNTSDSPIVCKTKFEFSAQRLQERCGFSVTRIGTTPVSTGLLPSGDIAVLIVRSDGATHMGIVDNSLSALKSCALVDEGQSTNQFPVEPLGAQRSAMYVAVGTGLVKMVYDAATNTLTRDWKQNYSFRNGRTGTTPTLMGLAGTPDKLVFVVDSQCVTTNVFTGAIGCDGNSAPSRLVAFARDDAAQPPVLVDLPASIRTTENSPAARGWDTVICNYPGYTPNAPKDGVSEFSTGVVKLRWNTRLRSFELGWSRPDLQCSGVPSISSGSNLVYFSGAESVDNTTYQYALRLNDDSSGRAGEEVLRLQAGPAFGSAGASNAAVFDQGNNTVINDDGSIIWPSAHGLVRVR